MSWGMGVPPGLARLGALPGLEISWRSVRDQMEVHEDQIGDQIRRSRIDQDVQVGHEVQDLD